MESILTERLVAVGLREHELRLLGRCELQISGGKQTDYFAGLAALQKRSDSS